MERATPVVIDLQRSTGERVDLSLFDGTTIVYALRRQTKRETFFATLVGRRLPSFTAAGGRACRPTCRARRWPRCSTAPICAR
ncbi:IclR family transcriptional regulator domain-containing protein [Teichococcus aestuarii]|uniref:IclR family transcriptional regulator domain-containing protein n=1 Tax=Teichococcus aestuarii TaxID=568898 RepID=UPI00361C4768